MSLERVELSPFVPAAEFHLPEAGEGHMQLHVGHVAFGISQAAEAPYGVRMGEIPTLATDELELGFRGIKTMLPYNQLPRATEPVDLVRGQWVAFGRGEGIVVKSPNGAITRQTGKLVDNALAAAVEADHGLSVVHAHLGVADRGIVAVRHFSRRYPTIVTLEEGLPQFVKATPPPRFA